MTVTATVELVAIEGRTLRFKVTCRDDSDVIGEGFHERANIDTSRCMSKMSKKQGVKGGV
jgi:fluoroacetyl-CoA thioesterase